MGITPEGGVETVPPPSATANIADLLAQSWILLSLRV